jgi:hypothetical protein
VRSGHGFRRQLGLTHGKKPQGRIKQADNALCQVTHEQQPATGASARSDKKTAPEGAVL